MVCVTACSGDEQVDELLSTADALLADLGIDIDVAPQVTESKAVQYVTATATVTGDQAGVEERLAEKLEEAGWEITKSESLDVSGTPAKWGHQLIAERDGKIARIALFDKVGARNPPTDGTRMQLSVANPNNALAWTHQN